MENQPIWLKDSLRDVVRIREPSEDRTSMFRMDRNERTWPIDDRLLASIKSEINSELLTCYPRTDELYALTAQMLGVKKEQLFFNTGSDQVIKSIFETYIGKGDKVLLHNPTFAMYGVYAKMMQAECEEVNFDKALCFDLGAYCDRITSFHPKLVVLENPNGYIGNSYTRDEVLKVVEAAAMNHALIVVDEAYIDYVDASVADFAARYDNLIVVRTFSKAWGLAGLRVGYAVSNETVIAGLNKVLPEFEPTTVSIIAVKAALEHKTLVADYIEEVKRVRKQFLAFLSAHGIDAVESNTHFVTCRLGAKLDLDRFRAEAKERHYLVRRPFSQPWMKEWVRIGLLPEKEMKEFEAFMKACMEGQNNEQ